MSKRAPLIVSGVVFSLVALIHLLRLIYQWDVIVAGQAVPMSLSVAGLIVAVILALWMFRAANKS